MYVVAIFFLSVCQLPCVIYFSFLLPTNLQSHRSGVIWPPHINRRPDSDFKRRLMDALQKPFSRKEYIKLFDMASIRTPLVKLRQVRNDAKFYPTEEMGNSYFDHYPGMLSCVYTDKYCIFCVIFFIVLPFVISPFRNLFLIVIVINQLGKVNSAELYFLPFMNFSVLSLTTHCCVVLIILDIANYPAVLKFQCSIGYTSV